MRALGLLILAAAAAVPIEVVLGQEAHTTRIEPRPYYGAVVTVEHGVRVTRPIPPDRHLIINPGGATPLILSADGEAIVEQRAAASSTNVPRGR